jgi:hypothetical protein
LLEPNVDLAAALTAHQREQFAVWQARQRLPWAREDLIAVGFAGMVGMTATWQFRGICWADGARTDVSVEVGVPVANIGEVLTLWGKHLAADVVTPMSLPLPWWSLLYERPERDIHEFARDAYRGSAFGDGLNVRSGLLTSTLAVLCCAGLGHVAPWSRPAVQLEAALTLETAVQHAGLREDEGS